MTVRIVENDDGTQYIQATTTKTIDTPKTTAKCSAKDPNSSDQ